MNFLLPPDVTFDRQSSNGGIVYTFRHQTMGALGRITLRDTPHGQCRITSEVVGDQSDPMTAKRAQIFKPLSDQLTTALDAALGGKGIIVPPMPTAAGPAERIASTLIPCERCGAGVALLVFADRAHNEGDMEDYARKMYPRYKELNLPTWVVGPPLGVPSDNTQAMTSKVWPEREPLQRLSPNQVNKQLDILLDAHC
ncbi:MAG: hypothetical protein AAF959_01120 [Cyanobacteria bacterium P01_D01_bin.56]